MSRVTENVPTWRGTYIELRFPSSVTHSRNTRICPFWCPHCKKSSHILVEWYENRKNQHRLYLEAPERQQMLFIIQNVAGDI